MMPKMGRLSGTARKLYNVLMYITQRQVQDLDLRGKVIEATHLFSARLDEIVEPVQTESSDIRTMAKKYLREMRRVEVDWEAPDARSGVVWSSMGLLSQVQLELHKGVMHVKWALPPDLMTLVRDPQRFTLLDIHAQARVHGYAAVALYEICSRYKTNPTGVTVANAPEWWVDALTNAPAAIDPTTGLKKLREWRKFKHEHVLKAITEINSYTDIEVRLIETKTGKSITGVQFGVRRKPSAAVGDSGSGPKVPAELATQAIRLQINLRDIAALLGAGHAQEVILAALAKLEQRQQREDLEEVASPTAYLRSVVQELAGMIRVDAAVPTTTPAQDAALDEQSSQTRRVDPFQAEQQAEEGARVLRERRRAELIEEMRALPPAHRQALQDKTVEELRRRTGLTPVLIRKIQAGDFSTGVLLSTMLEVYGASQYGPNWEAGPESAQGSLFDTN